MAEENSIQKALQTVLAGYQAARGEKFSANHPVAVALQDAARSLESSTPVTKRRSIKLVASAGKGNWAMVPWISLLDERETKSTQRGVYVVFLFRADMSGVYLTINQGVTEPKERLGRPMAREALQGRAVAIRERFPELATHSFALDGDIDLHVEAGLGADYESSTIGYRFYPVDALPLDDQLLRDVDVLLEVYDRYLADPIPLALSATGTWIFQANPKLWNLEGAVRKLKTLTWLVKQHADRIHAGDTVYLWQSGKSGGLLAVAEVLTDPAELEAAADETEFALAEERFDGRQLRVRLGVSKILLSPISRAELAVDPILSKLSILEQPLGTNFPVSVLEAKALASMVDSASERNERITLVEAARRVLAAHREPMKVDDIWTEIRERSLFESKGRTPEQTLHTTLLRATKGVDIASSQSVRLFYKAGPATFGLLEWLTDAERRALDSEEEAVRVSATLPPAPSPAAESKMELGPAVDALIKAIGRRGFVFEPWQVAAYVAALRTKPFVILAGVSGTGKSKLPALVCEATGGHRQLLPVRPDWTDSSDVLGYVDLQSNFRPGAVLQFAREAEGTPAKHHVCIIDEMNLARVEQYFAEVLSRIEDREDLGGAGFVTAPLLSLPLQRDDARWAAQRLPANLAIVGTVNMDESTHGFSRKVLDRAFTLELSDVDLRTWEVEEDQAWRPSAWPVSAWQPRAIRLGGFDASPEERTMIEKVIAVLGELNDLLVQAQLQVGYRVRDEIALFLVHAAEVSDAFVSRAGERVDPLDVVLQMKVLPRIVGGSASVRHLVVQMLGWAYDGTRYQEEDDAIRLMTEWKGAGRPARIATALYPRTAARLAMMWDRLLVEGYTSFWL
jgi:hypothetical protein